MTLCIIPFSTTRMSQMRANCSGPGKAPFSPASYVKVNPTVIRIAVAQLPETGPPRDYEENAQLPLQKNLGPPGEAVQGPRGQFGIPLSP